VQPLQLEPTESWLPIEIEMYGALSSGSFLSSREQQAEIEMASG